MSPRPSKYGLPAYLRFDTSRQCYRLTLINGKRKTLGKDKYKAIALANAYNAKMRPDYGVDMLLKHDDVLIPFDDVLRRIDERETLSKKVRSYLDQDMTRARDFFTMPIDSIDRKTCQDYLVKYHSNLEGDAYNKKISFLRKLFNYVVDAGLLQQNPADGIMRKKPKPKERQRITVEQYKAIHAIAPLWLQTAMDLSLQTTHARLEITRIEYRLRTPSQVRNGCVWYDSPVNGIYGTLFINRQKVVGNEEAHVAIPIGAALKEILDRSKDGVLCPFVVHRLPDSRTKGMSEYCTHPNQVAPEYLTKQFNKYRDQTELFKHMESKERPTFHEIRALSGKLFKEMGIDPQSRMAHRDARSTKTYTENHDKYVEVPHGEIAL